MLVQNHIRGPFDPKYVGDYRVVALKGNQVEVRPAIGGPTEMKHIKHVKYVLPADKYIKQIPDYSAFGRKTTLRINPDNIPDLHWKLADTYHTTNIGQVDSHVTGISTNYINVNTLSYAGGNSYKEWCETTLNTDMSNLQSNIKPIACPIVNTGKNKNIKYD